MMSKTARIQPNYNNLYNRQLPAHASHRMDCEFVTRILYKHSYFYIILLVFYCLFFYLYMAACAFCHCLIKT